MDNLAACLSSVCSLVWGPPLLILLIGTHIYLTIRLRIIQRYIPVAIKLSFSTKREGEGDISHFGALMTALAATVGTGNIVGVATAVASGGPGAVLWMWFTGVFGIATKYSEALLSVKYRITSSSGEMAGGPMYVLEHGVKARWLGVLFAAFTAIAAFGIGNMVQANGLSQLMQQTFKIEPYITGICLTVITFLVMIGGIKHIAVVCGKLVPFMAVFYILGCIIILAMTYKTIPQSVMLILNGAFSGQAAIGGFLGAGVKEAMRYGIARGLFSNESGMGSAPIVAAAAQTKNPVRQALVSSTGTFWDTVVICLLTGLVIVNSGDWQRGVRGDALTRLAFGHFGQWGEMFLTIALFTFVYSTILGWCYYGEKAIEYLFGTKFIKPYRYIWVAAVMVGSVARMPMVWDFADIANALMALPNIISLFILTPVVVAETKKYLWDEKLE